VAEQRTPHCACVETIRVFGSFARGATDVGDIDLAVKINTSRDKCLHARLIRRLAAGADPWSGWQTSLGARSPILEIHFENHPPEENMVLLYAAGDPLKRCLQRLRALTPDQSATHAPRHWEQAKTESLRGLEQHFGFLTATLDLLVVGNALQIERVDLEDCSNDHPPRGLSSGSEQRLQGGNAKPLLAALVYLRDLGIAPAEILLLNEDAYIGGPWPPVYTWQVLWTEASLSSFLKYEQECRDAVYLVSPRARKAPFAVLRMHILSEVALHNTLQKVGAIRAKASSETSEFEGFNRRLDELLHKEILTARE
jgi:hypothetical protein